MRSSRPLSPSLSLSLSLTRVISVSLLVCDAHANAEWVTTMGKVGLSKSDDEFEAELLGLFKKE